MNCGSTLRDGPNWYRTKLIVTKIIIICSKSTKKSLIFVQLGSLYFGLDWKARARSHNVQYTILVFDFNPMNSRFWYICSRICSVVDVDGSWAPTGKKRDLRQRYTASERRIDFLKQILRDMLDEPGTVLLATALRLTVNCIASPKYLDRKAGTSICSTSVKHWKFARCLIAKR